MDLEIDAHSFVEDSRHHRKRDVIGVELNQIELALLPHFMIDEFSFINRANVTSSDHLAADGILDSFHQFARVRIFDFHYFRLQEFLLDNSCCLGLGGVGTIQFDGVNGVS